MKNAKIQNPLSPCVTPFDGNINYLPGRPRRYRFNGKTGDLNAGKSNEVVSNSKQSFEIAPIAFRAFNNDMYGKNQAEDRAEFFFLNNNGDVCHLIASGITFTRVQDAFLDMYYNDWKFTDCIVKITPEHKTGESDRGKYDYWIFNFDVQQREFELPNLPPCIFAIDSITAENDVTKYFENWEVPDNLEDIKLIGF